MPASATFCRELSGTRLDAQFSAEDMPDDLPKDVALCLYRVLQEAVNNAMKHAEARHLTVRLQGGAAEIRLEVADDGKGFDQASAAQRPRVRTVSMSERLALVARRVLRSSRGPARARPFARGCRCAQPAPQRRVD